jgi:ribose-phosphate pyrophosphokinase
MILYNGREVHFGRYPNGEVNLRKFKIDPQDLDHVVTLKYEGDEDLFHLLLVRDALSVRPILRILYAPYSRMDRESDVFIFSLKTFAKFINAMDWERVVIYEPHSDVTPALLDRVQVVHVTASERMKDEIDRSFDGQSYQVCYPDVGALKRYQEDFEDADSLVGFKVRDFETGRILSLDIQGRRVSDNVAIVDDLCSKGGTFVLTAEKLRALGFKKVVLAVAHCENTVYDGVVFSSGLIDKVITTDSILSRNDFPDRLIRLSMSEFPWNRS